MRFIAVDSTGEQRKRGRALERWQRYLAELRRRREQAERDRKRRLLWLLMIWISILESIPTQSFFPAHFAAGDKPEQKRQPKPSRKSEEKAEIVDTRTDDERRYLYDYATRRGEEHLEVYDGLTYADIVAYNKIHRPWLFPAFKPTPGMPKRYSSEPVHVWTLLFEMQYPHCRPDAIAALKLVVDPTAHDWINACEKEIDGLSYKNLRQCWSKTPEMTVYEFPRAAARWRVEQRREAEERKKEAKETLAADPKPLGLD
jgi:hypothetical protein